MNLPHTCHKNANDCGNLDNFSSHCKRQSKRCHERYLSRRKKKVRANAVMEVTCDVNKYEKNKKPEQTLS